jgi:hypothetical protein
MNQVSSILGKLGLKNRREIGPFAVQHGLLLSPLPPNGSE